MATEAFIIAITTQGTREVQRDMQSIGTSGVTAAKQVDAVAPAADRAMKSLLGLGTGFKIAMDAARVSQAQVRAFNLAINSMAQSMAAAQFGAFPEAMRAFTTAAVQAQAEMRNLGLALDGIGRGAALMGLRNFGTALREATSAAALAQTEMRNLGLALEGIGRGAAIMGLRNFGTALREATSAAALAQTEMRNLGIALVEVGNAASLAGMRNLGVALTDYTVAARAAAGGSNEAGSAMRNMSRDVSALRGSLSLMRNLLVTFSFLRAITAVTEGISEVQQTSNMLSQVTPNVKAQSEAFDQLAASAMKVHAPLESFTQMVVAIERSSAAFGKTSADVTKATQTMFASFALSGLDTGTISRVGKDMREVFNLGIVQGRQFRAIVTQDQSEALLLSKYIVATGKDAAAANKALEEMRGRGETPSIYEMSQKFKGAFTGQDVLNANIAGHDAEMAMLGRTTVTVGQAFTDLHTSFAAFLNDANTATGITASLSQGVEFLAKNIHLVIFAFAALATVLTLRYILFPLIADVYALGAAVVTTAFDIGVNMVSALGSAVIAMMSFGATTVATMGEMVVAAITEAVASFVAFGAAMLAAFVPMLVVGAAVAAVVLTLGTAIYGLLSPLGKLAGINPFNDMKLTLADLPDVFDTAFATITNHFPLVTAVLSAMWDDMVNNMKNSITEKLFNYSPMRIMYTPQQLKDLQGYKPLPTNTSDLPIKRLRQAARDEYAMGQWDKFLAPDRDLLQQNGGKPPTDVVDTSKVQAARAAFDQLVASVSPAFKVTAELEKVQKAYNRAAKAGVDVNAELAKAGLTRSEFERRLIRDVDGLKNADTDYAENVKKLTDDAKKYGYALDEVTRKLLLYKIANLEAHPQSLQAGIDLAHAKSDLTLGDQGTTAEKIVSSALGFQNAPIIAQTEIKALSQDFATGALKADGFNHAMIEVLKTQRDLASGEVLAEMEQQEKMLNKGAIAAQVLASVYERFNAGNVFKIQMQAINDEVAKFPQLADKASLAVRELQLQFLSTQTDALSGFQRGILESQKSMNDFASTAQNTVTTAFNDMTDAITKFVMTGKIGFMSFVRDIQTNLTKLAVQQTITGPLSNMLGFNQQGSGGIFGNGGILGSIFGGSGLGGAGNGVLGSSAANPMYVTFASDGSLVQSLSSGGSSAVGGSSSSGIFSSLFGPSNGANANGGDIFSNLFGSSGFIANLFSGGGGQGSLSNSLLNLFGSGQSGSGIGELMSAANGASSGGGLMDIFSSIAGFLGFATGGEFTVGGQGGTDSQFVPFKATPGEIVSVRRPGDAGNSDGPPMVSVALHVHGVQDVDGFQRSQGQIMGNLGGMIAQAVQRNGKG